MIYQNLKSLFALMLSVIGTAIAHANDAMPAVEYPVDNAKPDSPLVVLVSGDGGWAEIDQELAERWQNRGWPVVGVNALKYFWKERTPDGFTNDLAELIQSYRTKWGERPVILAGFSFGAVVVPFAGNRLPDAIRENVAAMVLISPTENSIWKAGLRSWFGGGDTGPPVGPELDALAPLPTFVLTGEKDPDAFHQWNERSGLQHYIWPGDHHLDRNYDRIGMVVVEFYTKTRGNLER